MPVDPLERARVAVVVDVDADSCAMLWPHQHVENVADGEVLSAIDIFRARHDRAAPIADRRFKTVCGSAGNFRPDRAARHHRTVIRDRSAADFAFRVAETSGGNLGGES